MNNRLILLAAVFFIISNVSFGQDLKVYTDARQAIGAARAEGKLIVFFLWDSRDKKHLKIAEKLKVDLNRLNNEFVLVNLSHSAKSNRDLFSGKFGKDLTNLPVAVVSSENGEAITSTHGLDPLEYDRLLYSGRINGGKITDPLMLASLKESLEKVGEERGFLTPMVEDLKQQKVGLTKMRQWSRKDGTSFDAVLLEALGEYGVFVDKSGNSSKIKFVDLSATDVQFLQSVLQVK